MTTDTFIRQHANDDVRDLALQKAKYPDVDMKYALDQIAGRQIARRKLPMWAEKEGVIFPSHLSLEQCSSEFTAMYKARLVRNLLMCDNSSYSSIAPITLVDLTAGFGVDFTLMVKALQEEQRFQNQKYVYVERQEELCQIAKHNFDVLGVNHVDVVCGDGVDYLHDLQRSCVIFLDPARRNSYGGRTFAISDCTPNVLSIQEELLEKSIFVVLKLSPMLDISATIEALGENHVREIHIISVDNECKELLVVMSKEAISTRVFCVNNDHVLSYFIKEQAPIIVAQQVSVGQYFYEPYVSIMKTKCFGLLCQRYGVEAVGLNSHFFISSQFIEDFPGRRFQVFAISSMNKKDLKNHLRGVSKANITTRNFPLSVQELRKRLKLSDGGDVYIFATTIGENNHRLFICRQINTKKED